MLIQNVWTDTISVSLENGRSLSIGVWQNANVSESDAETIRNLYYDSIILVGTVNEFLSASIEVSSAEILDMNSNPIEIIASPWAGKYIDVLSINVKRVFDTTAYDTNVAGEFYIGSGGKLWDLDLSFSASDLLRIGIDEWETLPDEPITLTESTGDPATWDGTLKIDISYRIVSL